MTHTKTAGRSDSKRPRSEKRRIEREERTEFLSVLTNRAPKPTKRVRNFLVAVIDGGYTPKRAA